MEGPFVAQVTEDINTRKILQTRDTIVLFTGRQPKNATHIEDLKYVIESFPHPNVEGGNGQLDSGGTVPDNCDIWPKFTDWNKLSTEQQNETKTFLMMRYSIEDLHLAYDQYYIQKGKTPSSIDYRIFINNWRGNKTKRRTQSLAEMMRSLEQKDDENHRKQDEQQQLVSQLDLVNHIYNGQLRQVNTLESENNDLRDVVHRLENDFDQERQDKEHLREITEVQGRHVYQLRRTITEKDRQLCEKCTRLREVEDTKDEYEGVIKRQRLMIRERKEEMKGLKNENMELNDRVGELYDKNVDLCAKNGHLNDRVGQFCDRVIEQSAIMNELNHKNVEKDATIDEQSATINELNHKNDEQSATINELNHKNDEQSATIHELSDENNNLHSENNGLKSNVTELCATVKNLLQQNQDQAKTIRELVEQTKLLVNSNGSKSKTIDDLKNKIQQEIHVNQTKEQIIAEQSQQLEEQKAIIAEQKEKIAKYKNDDKEWRVKMEEQEKINQDLYSKLDDVKQLCNQLMKKVANGTK